MTTASLRICLTMFAATTLAACASTPSHVGTTPPPRVAAVSAAEVDAVFDLLMAGKESHARRQLDRLLKRDPMSANARLLRDSIDRNPTELLGPQSYPYTVRAGDTPVELAVRFLGNRLKAYQLIRYNTLRVPVTLVAGQKIRIPGEPPRLEPVRRPEPVAPRPVPGTPLAAKPRPVAPRPIAPVADPAAARAARAAGLAALNGGNVERAVGLLRRAASLDPGNPVIARDLARAERIAATVRAHR